MKISDKPLLFSTASYSFLKSAMLATEKFDDGRIARSIDSDGNPSEADLPFPDGERYHRLLTSVEDREVVLLGGTITDRETMELFDIGNTIVDNFASTLSIMLPYFGGSTQERATARQEAVKAKYRARLISAIPRAENGNRVYLLDLHSEGIPHYFESGLTARHIYAKPLVMKAAVELARICQGKQRAAVTVPSGSSSDPEPIDPFCLASTDTGRAKWVESLTRDMVASGIAVQPSFIIKRRSGPTSTEVLDISADVEGVSVVIYDDMIRTGGSLIKAARSYLGKGAAAVAAVSTHGVLPDDALSRIKESGTLKALIVTDSHPRVKELEDDFLRVVSTAELLTRNLLNGR